MPETQFDHANRALRNEPPIVISGGTSPNAVSHLAHSIEQSLERFTSGKEPPPLFVVAQETDARASVHEIIELGYPRGTGVLMRTSGSTTGTGKIVAIPWNSLIASASATHQYLGGEGAWINVLPIQHIAGFQTVARSVVAGHAPLSVDMTDEESLRTALASCRDHNIYMSQVPTQLMRTLRDDRLTELLANGVAADIVGGAAASARVLQMAQKAGIRVHTSYGMTETCGGCVYDGYAIGDTRISINTRGRISLTGSCVALGYLGGIETEAFSFEHTACGEIRTHHTKDAGSISGTPPKLDVLGRIDDAITTGGLTIMPSLVEKAISDGFGIQCVVLGVADSMWGERTVLVTNSFVDLSEIRAHVNSRFEKGWAPRQLVTLKKLDVSKCRHNEEGWPITPSGKIDRRELQIALQQYLDNSPHNSM